MDELVRHPKVLDAVESVIGPNILIYHLTSWLKEPHDPAHVSWHQDGTYFGLEPAEQITAWIALTDSTPEMGCIRLLPGQPRDRAASAQGHVHARQPVVARPDHRASAGLHALGDDAAQGRADFAAPHSHRAFIRAEPHRPTPHRHRRQLHPAALPPGQRRAGDRRPGTRPRRLRAISIRSRGRPATSMRARALCMPRRWRGSSNPTRCWRRAADRATSVSDPTADRVIASRRAGALTRADRHAGCRR